MITLTIRVTPDELDAIDEAVKILGISRTKFMTDAAIERARAVLEGK
jgi:uncharacterized protein (DUF1778 family)